MACPPDGLQSGAEYTERGDRPLSGSRFSDKRALMADKATHLLVGALLVAGYFAGLPAHLWQDPPAFAAPVDGWLPAQGELRWRFNELESLPAGALLPVPAVRGQQRLRLAHMQAGRLLIQDYQPGQGWQAGRAEEALTAGVSGDAGQWLPLPGSDGGLLLDGPTPLSGARLVALPIEKVGHELTPVPADSARAGLPARLAGGGMLLPLWLGEQLQVLRLDSQGRLQAQQTLARGRSAGVPALIADSQASVWLFAPHQQGAVLYQGVSAGRHWRPLAVDWPVARPLALTRRGEGHWWLLSMDESSARLAIHESRDAGSRWRELPDYAVSLPDGGGECEADLLAHTDSAGLLELLYLGADCRLRHGRLQPGEGV